jgi:hypothetical protein
MQCGQAIRREFAKKLPIPDANFNQPDQEDLI